MGWGFGSKPFTIQCVETADEMDHELLALRRAREAQVSPSTMRGLFGDLWGRGDLRRMHG